MNFVISCVRQVYSKDMSKIFISIPHVKPNLAIECTHGLVINYISRLFHPYATLVPECGKDYYDLTVTVENGRCVVSSLHEKEKITTGIVPYIENFLIRNSCADCGYLMLHGGGVSLNGSAFIFLADSMIGKSTLITHLCEKGFEYITDDRLVVDVNNLTVMPFNKTIMLRPEGKDILSTTYGHTFVTESFRYKKIVREFFDPDLFITENTKIKKIFVIDRKDGIKLHSETIKREMRYSELMKYCLSIKDLEKAVDFVTLGKVEMEKVQYSNLDDMASFIRCQG